MSDAERKEAEEMIKNATIEELAEWATWAEARDWTWPQDIAAALREIIRLRKVINPNE